MARQAQRHVNNNVHTLRFSGRKFRLGHDFLYLHSFDYLHASLRSLGFIHERGPGRLRRVAVLASIRHTVYLPAVSRKLNTLNGLEELDFAFVELAHGKLKHIN